MGNVRRRYRELDKRGIWTMKNFPSDGALDGRRWNLPCMLERGVLWDFVDKEWDFLVGGNLGIFVLFNESNLATVVMSKCGRDVRIKPPRQCFEFIKLSERRFKGVNFLKLLSMCLENVLGVNVMFRRIAIVMFLNILCTKSCFSSKVRAASHCLCVNRLIK